MTFWAYRLLVVPVLALAMPALAVLNRKVRRGLALRMKPRPFPEFRERPLWIHAASGEFEYAKPVIREWRERFPGIPVVVTYFSPTFALGVENFPGVDFAMPLPLDLPGPCASFLRHVNPRMLLIARTDFWPEMLHQVRRRGIPVRVFSYTQREGKSHWLTRFQLGMADEVDCVSADDVRNLEGASVATKVSVLGDTRYDQVRYRLDHPKVLPPVLEPVRLCLVAGSTWAQDEDVLLPAVAPSLSAGRLQMILVPHEPTEDHVRALKQQLEERGLSYVLYSEQRRWDDKHVLLVDRVGVLAELYLWADIAFVGGSFKRGVHSVMEALGAGAATLVGPRCRNNREALEFAELKLAGMSPLTIVIDQVAMRARVEELVGNAPALARLRQALKDEFDRRLGASRRLVETLI